MKVLALRRTSKSITARTTYIYTFKGTTSLETLHAMACHFVMTFFFYKQSPHDSIIKSYNTVLLKDET